MANIEVIGTYEQASHLCTINNKISYLYKEVMGSIYVVYGDQKYGPYESATFTAEFSNGIAYCAQVDGLWSVYVNGDQMTNGYTDLALPLLEQDGKPVVKAHTAEGWVIIQGKEKIAGPFPHIKFIKYVEGRLHYGVRKENGKFVLISDGSEGQEYTGISTPIRVNNKIVFGAKKDSGVQVLNYDGQEIAAVEEIGRIMNASNKLVYTAKKAEKEWHVIYDNKDYGPYRMVGPIIEYDGGIAYTGTDGVNWNIYLNGEKQDQPTSRGIGTLTLIDGKLSFVHLNKRGWCFVRIGGKDLPKEYVSVKHLKEWKGNPVFAAAEGDKVLNWRVSLNGLQVGDPYKDILALEPHGDTLYALCIKPNLRADLLKITE